MNQKFNDQLYQSSQAFYEAGYTLDDKKVSQYMAKVMGWMCAGVFTTFAVAIMTILFVFPRPQVATLLFDGPGFLGIFIAQLALVFIFSFGLRKMNVGGAVACYLLYSAVTGVTFSVLFLIFHLSSILFVFGLTGLLFLSMAIYGYVTKKDLTKLGSLMFFALFGIIIANLLNMLIYKSVGLDLAICCIGIVVFIGLIAYDAQKVKDFYISAVIEGGQDENGDLVRKMAIFGAFALYLDFINLFLRLLQLFGKRRN